MQCLVFDRGRLVLVFGDIGEGTRGAPRNSGGIAQRLAAHPHPGGRAARLRATHRQAGSRGPELEVQGLIGSRGAQIALDRREHSGAIRGVDAFGQDPARRFHRARGRRQVQDLA